MEARLSVFGSHHSTEAVWENKAFGKKDVALEPRCSGSLQLIAALLGKLSRILWESI
jgi:hypothetical protein